MSVPKKRYRPPTKKQIEALASCVVFAVSHFGRKNHGMMITLGGPNRGKVQPWQDQFFDALDAVGLVYDRDAYYAKIDGKKGKRK